MLHLHIGAGVVVITIITQEVYELRDAPSMKKELILKFRVGTNSAKSEFAMIQCFEDDSIKMVLVFYLGIAEN